MVNNKFWTYICVHTIFFLAMATLPGLKTHIVNAAPAVNQCTAVAQDDFGPASTDETFQKVPAALNIDQLRGRCVHRLLFIIFEQPGLRKA